MLTARGNFTDEATVKITSALIQQHKQKKAERVHILRFVLVYLFYFMIEVVHDITLSFEHCDLVRGQKLKS